MRTLLFFLSVACFPSAFASPTTLINQNLAPLTPKHGNSKTEPFLTSPGDEVRLLPKLGRQNFSSLNPDSTGVYYTLWTGDNLSVPVLAGSQCKKKSETKSTCTTGEARESNEASESLTGDSRGAQNSLASLDSCIEKAPAETREMRIATDASNVSMAASGSSAPPSQNLQQERGDVKCISVDGILVIHHQSKENPNPVSSSAASTFNPEGAACPQREASPVALSKQEVKLSVAEVFVSLIEQEPHFSVEPQTLESLRFRK